MKLLASNIVKGKCLINMHTTPKVTRVRVRVRECKSVSVCTYVRVCVHACVRAGRIRKRERGHVCDHLCSVLDMELDAYLLVWIQSIL